MDLDGQMNYICLTYKKVGLLHFTKQLEGEHKGADLHDVRGLGLIQNHFQMILHLAKHLILVCGLLQYKPWYLFIQ